METSLVGAFSCCLQGFERVTLHSNMSEHRCMLYACCPLLFGLGMEANVPSFGLLVYIRMLQKGIASLYDFRNIPQLSAVDFGRSGDGVYSSPFLCGAGGAFSQWLPRPLLGTRSTEGLGLGSSPFWASALPVFFQPSTRQTQKLDSPSPSFSRL